MTAMWNPLMGHVSATYSVRGGEDLALSTRLDFNMYSYESNLALGCEMWQRKLREDSSHAVLKARVDLHGLGVTWQGQLNNALLLQVGGSLSPLRGVSKLGLELHFAT